MDKIKSETKIFGNINFILDKIEHDGYFETIQSSFHQIFNKEMTFAVQGKPSPELKKIKSGHVKFDIQNQLINNTYIFKENLKLITVKIVEQIWSDKMKGDNIQETIKVAMDEINKGKFERILEVDEEMNYSSGFHSYRSGDKFINESKYSQMKRSIIAEEENSESESISRSEGGSSQFRKGATDIVFSGLSSELEDIEVESLEELNLQKKSYAGDAEKTMKNYRQSGILQPLATVKRRLISLQISRDILNWILRGII